jgi:hypothetical protein
MNRKWPDKSWKLALKSQKKKRPEEKQNKLFQDVAKAAAPL